jgi:hypothetical protein
MGAGMSNARTSRIKAAKKPVEADLGFHWRPVNIALFGVGLIAVVAGFVFLARGSMTLAPLLLVGGYCVFIPASLLVRGGSPNEGE